MVDRYQVYPVDEKDHREIRPTRQVLTLKLSTVPAAVESERTGSPSSISCYCNTSTLVAHLAEAEANATVNSKDKEPWNVENPFQRSSGMQRTPPTPSLRSTPEQATPTKNTTLVKIAHSWN
ncbi:hypothetical protein CVS40_1572 [Lucilia cuprina]|nr:hypothetical protein CVS40_1572 [Lucilia cuprina]